MSRKAILSKIRDATVNLDIDAVKKACRKALDASIPAYEAVVEGMARGMEIIGRKYEAGFEYVCEIESVKLFSKPKY